MPPVVIVIGPPHVGGGVVVVVVVVVGGCDGCEGVHAASNKLSTAIAISRFLLNGGSNAR